MSNDLQKIGEGHVFQVSHETLKRVQTYLTDACVDWEAATMFPQFETPGTLELKKKAFEFATYQAIQAKASHYLKG